MAGNIITTNLCDRSDWHLDDRVNKAVIENMDTFKKAVGAMRRNMPFQFFFDGTNLRNLMQLIIENYL